MNAKDAIRSTMDMSLTVLNTYVSDLSDEDLLRRPHPDCNHLAWQLGHLISSEVGLLEGICPGKAPELPAGFAERHAKENRQVDDPSQFATKQQYLDLFQNVRQATLAALDQLPDSELDSPSPENYRQYFPTVGHLFGLIASHPMMHAGQFVIVRRQLGKPVVM